MDTRNILVALEFLALLAMLFISFSTMSRQCEIRDSKGIIHVANCSVIYKYDK